MKKHVPWILAGVGILLFVKYIVLGLIAWDKIFHPQRIEPPTSPFLTPFFGLLG